MTEERRERLGLPFPANEYRGGGAANEYREGGAAFRGGFPLPAIL
mgnify:CR=1 FL=1